MNLLVWNVSYWIDGTMDWNPPETRDIRMIASAANIKTLAIAHMDLNHGYDLDISCVGGVSEGMILK